MPDDLQVLVARLEIGELLARYSTALDGRDWDLLAEVFTPDAECDDGVPGQSARGGRDHRPGPGHDRRPGTRPSTWWATSSSPYAATRRPPTAT